MMRLGAAMLFCAATALAQQVTSFDKLPAAVSRFDDSRVRNTLPCEVEPGKPALNFGLRFQTGYALRTSLDVYAGGRHHWYIVFRVTPDFPAGPPVYFLDSIDLPQAVRTDIEVESSGSFLVGAGRYTVKWILLDDLGRECRQDWTIDARLSVGERSAKVVMPPGTVGDVSWRPAVITPPVTKSRHVSILLNAAMPAAPRAGQMADRWGMLLSMLASVVEQMPEASVRVVAFDTDQQRELFRKDDFHSEDMNGLSRVVNAWERWAVNYQVLQKPLGGWDLLRDVENKEIHATEPCDTAIFLGVQQERFDKLPPGMPGPQTAPRFFYLKYGPAPEMPRHIVREARGGGGRGGAMQDMGSTSPLTPPCAADQPDLIEQSVRHMNGKIFAICSPASFSKALASIEHVNH